MGVTGLLQHLKDIQEKTTLSKYKGKTLAVDTYGWLHRGLISCAQDLCTDEPTRGYITSVMKKIDMVRHFGVEPVMVFDGSALPTKEATNAERRLKREKAREAAQNSLQRGDRKSAWKEFMKAAAVTPEMAKSVMVELDRRHVKYVVAPYEADPQMVYLEKIGVVDGILSEDSDLLVFGCRRLVTKLNDYGECIEICRDDFHRVPRMALDKYTHAQWRLVAILSGCDYTKGIPGVGLKTAFNVVSRLGDLTSIIASFKADNKTIPDEFLDEALKADLAFQYQKVFDPASNAVTTLCEIPPDSDLDMSVLELCCGGSLEPHIHRGICTGKLHPRTHTPLISREQNLSAPRSQSVNFQQTTTTTSTNGLSTRASSATQTSKSFSSTKSIESYFKSDKPAISASIFTTNLKRPSQKSNQLSPSSKKLRRFQNTSGVDVPNDPAGAGSPGATQSKFFPAAIPPVSVSLVCPKPNDADFGFETGDSEVPDSSSPVRNDKHEDTCVTDDDADADADASLSSGGSSSMLNSAAYLQSQTSVSTKVDSDNDDGYDDELEESPIKPEKINLSWRKMFSLGASNGDATCTVKKPTLIRKAEAFKVSVATPEKKSAPQSDFEERSSDASLDGSSSPHTPEEHVPEKATLLEDNSQNKSSQQTFISETEDEFDISPRRSARLSSQQSSTSKLSRFAFAG
ncbi:hypothetical protein JCM33374_g1023 [Metschnikowia sp. JCM 33374]|nr:hypothetical protein JCM33374_g1023 [Metschnikowia sp. JCM 33374]